MSTLDPFNAQEWGPSLWKIIHTMAAAYPASPTPQYKASCRQFFYSLRHLLPCPTCQQHYNVLLSRQQPQVNSSEDLQKWVLWMHNEINARLKQGKAWTLEEMQRVYPPVEGGKDLNEESAPPTPVQTPAILKRPIRVQPQSAPLRPTPTPPTNSTIQSLQRKLIKRTLPKRQGSIKKRIIAQKQNLNAIRHFGVPNSGISVPQKQAPRQVAVQKQAPRQVAIQKHLHAESTPTSSARHRSLPKRKKKKDCGCGK